MSKFESSFNDQAERYDRYRPHYPEALVTAVMEYAGIPQDGSMLEIGCGTGKATQSFAKFGKKIVGVDPGGKLLEIARSHCLEFPTVSFVESTFEEWEHPGETFDLIYSAQSFHWVPEEIRYTKTYELLKPNGTLALFWNCIKDDTEFSRAENEIWVKHLGEKMRGSYAERFEQEGLLELEDFRRSSLFHSVEYHQFPHAITYDREHYLGLERTYSDNAKMDATIREPLFSDIGDLIDSSGGKVTVPYTAVLFIGRRV